jgi:hypothetical protein
MKTLLTLALLATLASCSHQKVTEPTGQITENRNLFAKGGMSVAPDGTIIAFGDSSEAAKDLAAYARALLAAKLISTGIGATKDITETITKATTN